jgi:hypothetical protein
MFYEGAQMIGTMLAGTAALIAAPTLGGLAWRRLPLRSWEPGPPAAVPLALIPDAGHFAAFTQPDRFLAELRTRVRPLAAAPRLRPPGRRDHRPVRLLDGMERAGGLAAAGWAQAEPAFRAARSSRLR